METVSVNIPPMSRVNLPSSRYEDYRYDYRMEKTLPNKILVDLIKEQIKKYDLNMRDIEREAGLRKDGIRNILRGKSKNPRIDTHQKIMAAIERIKENKPIIRKGSKNTEESDIDRQFSELREMLSSMQQVMLQLSREIGVSTPEIEHLQGFSQVPSMKKPF